MILHLLRHTKTLCPVGVCYGQSDVALAPSFELEKQSVIKKIKDIHFTHVYSSPLKRCAHLALSFAGSKPLLYDNRLMELHFGDWENKPWSEIDQTPEAALWFADYVNTACPGGESYSQLRNRVQDFLSEIAVLHSNTSVLIVTHGGVIRTILSVVKKITPELLFAQKIDYGHFCTIEI